MITHEENDIVLNLTPSHICSVFRHVNMETKFSISTLLTLFFHMMKEKKK